MAEQEKPKRGPGRPRKKGVIENEKILSEASPRLTMEEKSKVSSGLSKISLSNKFEDALTRIKQEGLLFDFNLYNPFIQNTRLKMISSWPSTFDPTDIAKFLQQPQWHEQQLRSASWALSSSQYLYYKILREACDIPLFKHFVSPPLLEVNEFKSKKFLKEEAFVDEWLRRFDVINTLKRVALEVKREGKSTYVIRQKINEKSGMPDYVAWQKLPSNFVKLTSIGEHGYIASFDLMVFLTEGFSPTQYPEYIQQIWQEMNDIGAVDKTKAGSIDFNKLNSFKYQSGKGASKGTLEVTGKDRYMYWVELPQDLCFTFSSDTSHPWAAPDTMGLFSSLQELTDYSILAGLIASTPLTAILTGQAETVKDPEPGQSQTILSPSAMLSFQNAFNMIASSNTKAFLAPFKDLKLQSLPNVPNSSNIKTAALQNFISTAGEGGLIVATDKPSVAMIKGAQLMAASQYESVTRQFEGILNMLLNYTTGLEYDWRVKLWGDIYSFDTTVKSLKEQVQSGASYLLPKLASAQDMSMTEVRATNRYMEAFEVYEGFKQLNYSSSLLGVKEGEQEKGEVGRPKVEIDELENDNTATSQEAGNNVSDIKEFSSGETCSICGQIKEVELMVCEECMEKFLEEEGGTENVKNA